MKMRNRMLSTTIFSVLFFGQTLYAAAGNQADIDAGAFAGQDLHLRCRELISYQTSSTDYLVKNSLVLQGGFSISIGAYQYSGDRAVIWLASSTEAARAPSLRRAAGQASTYHKAAVYMQGNISTHKAKGPATAKPGMKVIEPGQTAILWFDVSGGIFATADSRSDSDPRGLGLYKTAFSVLKNTGSGPGTGIEEPASVMAGEQKLQLQAVDQPTQTPGATGQSPSETLQFRYRINFSPAGETPFKIEWDSINKIGTFIGRFYFWQKQDEAGDILELQGDNAVIFYSDQEPNAIQETGRSLDILAGRNIEAIYLSGNVVMTEGRRSIQADEIYYNFEIKRALAINALMRNFDTTEGIPIYIRAARIKQLAENKFAAEDITLTSSEFYDPQISLNASSVTLTDTTTIEQQQDEVHRESWDAEIKDVSLKYYDHTIFYWPSMRTNMQRPDLPIKSASVGYDSNWGTSVETQWYLSRLLGLEEPEGTDTTLALDYYSRRGAGVGIESDYTGDNYFGKLLGYVIDDHGKDNLGRTWSRRHIEPPRELRGRFRWQHRHFLPYNWQLTTEISYSSDEHFIESFYRDEFNVGKEQETLLHLKRIEDNWGLSLLGNVRINDFVNKLEELPSAEFHWTGQSFWDDRLTLYSDTQVSRFRQRYAESNMTHNRENIYSLATTRNEIDLPLSYDRIRIVPFVAGTVAYEDEFGFYRDLDGGTDKNVDEVWYGETGIRVAPAAYWKVFPEVQSKVWDVNQLRHVIEPHLTAIQYTQAKSIIEQRDTVNFGISQRLQTKRGIGKNQRTVDWMRLDMDVTWVNDSGSAKSGPDRFLWNKPFIPIINTYQPPMGGILQIDRRSSAIFGPRRNNFTADFSWLMGDTTALLSDMYYDMQSGVVEQFNIGFTHMRWPNLSYYIGSRYLKRINNGLGEKGSNSANFAITYVLDPRYTLVFSQQVDFDYKKTIQSNFTLIRQYHRMYWSITYSADESLNEHAVVFSLWPQGVPDLSIGQRKYTTVGGAAGY